MTQAAVNNAKVLYRLSAKREDVEKAEQLFFLTPELQKTLENPTIPNAKKYEIIERVFALEGLPEVITNFVKMMCRIGYCDEMRDIYKAFYQYWDKENHILRAEFISAGEPVKEEVEEAEQLLQSKYPEEKIASTGRLVYDGSNEVPYVRGNKKIGRNDPCPCGSGKKYKQCCGR